MYQSEEREGHDGEGSSLCAGHEDAKYCKF